MKKKILCAIVSAVMVVGTLVGCGSTGVSTSSEASGVRKVVSVEESILTKLTPGKSTKKDAEKILDDYNFTHKDSYGVLRATNTGLFLGYEYQPYEIDFYGDNDEEHSGILKWYELKVAFKDVEDYTNGIEDIEEYLESISLGVTATRKDSDFTYHMFLMDDNDDYITYLESYSKTYDDVPDNYYPTMIKIDYHIQYKESNFSGTGVKWKDSKGNKYTPKIDKGIENADTTESVYSTESVY